MQHNSNSNKLVLCNEVGLIIAELLLITGVQMSSSTQYQRTAAASSSERQSVQSCVSNAAVMNAL